MVILKDNVRKIYGIFDKVENEIVQLFLSNSDDGARRIAHSCVVNNSDKIRLIDFDLIEVNFYSTNENDNELHYSVIANFSELDDDL